MLSARNHSNTRLITLTEEWSHFHASKCIISTKTNKNNCLPKDEDSSQSQRYCSFRKMLTAEGRGCQKSIKKVMVENIFIWSRFWKFQTKTLKAKWFVRFLDTGWSNFVNWERANFVHFWKFFGHSFHVLRDIKFKK